MDHHRRQPPSLSRPAWSASRRTLFGACAGGMLTLVHEVAAAPVDARPRRNRRRRGRAQITPPPEGLVVCDPSATSGIAGLVLIGPMCPVVTVDDPCPDRPFAATIAVLDARGRTVCKTDSGDDGRFRVGLPPGVYELAPVNGVADLPYASPVVVTVEPGHYTQVTVSYDSGIR